MMMRKIIIIAIISFVSIASSAQGIGGQVISPMKKPNTTKTSGVVKKQKRKLNTDQSSKTEIKEAKVAEAVGYDVEITCNVPSAIIYFDGRMNGKASDGTYFLKTGSHIVKLETDGYEVYEDTIEVNSESRSFSFAMKKIEKIIPDVIKKLMNNMVEVMGGTFTMGASSEQINTAFDSEKPAHKVTVSSYSIGKFEVTQEEWVSVMGYNPSKFKGAKRPVENVTWNECQDFIHKLNEMTGMNFRLPTEAEWEFAARGGLRSIGYLYSGGDMLDRVAWFYNNSGHSSHEVGQKLPNELGLFDMNGNVWEWCHDFYSGYGYTNQIDPKGPTNGAFRVYRGGSWGSSDNYSRLTIRLSKLPNEPDFYIGFRLAK